MRPARTDYELRQLFRSLFLIILIMVLHPLIRVIVVLLGTVMVFSGLAGPLLAQTGQDLMS